MEQDIQPLDLQRMFIGDIPLAYLVEIVVRIGIIYIVAILFLHLLGKKNARQLNPLEQLIIIALGSATGDSMLYPDVPIIHAAVIIGVIMCLTYIIERVKERIPYLEQATENAPRIIIENGRLQKDVLEQEGFSKKELYSQLREQGITHISQVKTAILEVSGAVSVLRNTRKKKTGNLFNTPYIGA